MIGHEDLWLFIYRERMVVYCRQCEEAKVLLLRKCLPVCLQVLLTRGLFSLTNCHQYLRKLQQHQQPQIYVVCVSSTTMHCSLVQYIKALTQEVVKYLIEVFPLVSLPPP